MKRNAQAFSWGTGIGTLGGLIGLGGAEFRLPVLAGIFQFRLLDAIVINLLVSLGVCRTWGRGSDRLIATCWSQQRGDRR
jgi:hypothetical protein